MTLPRPWFLLASLLSAALTGLLFLPGLHGGFVFDDGSNIVENQAIHLATLDVKSIQQVAFGIQPGGITRVLPTITLALDYWRGGGLNPAVFKATNIAIHVLTACVLAGFFRTLLLTTGVSRQRAEFGGLALALAWAIHPLQVSSVLYVVQRMQTLCTLFVVLALWAYLKARRAQIDGHSGRTGWLLAFLCWILAFGCKEDAALLPAYTLALELTVLHFQCADPAQTRKLRRGYLYATLTGAALFLLVVIPHYWSWDNYPGRDFSTWERLLTQARVLCMYLWEILLPLPQHMPFYYDWIQPSQSLLHPWTTLLSVLLLLTLLVTAWTLRTLRPLFALGIFLFFAGHFMTSNVIGLEMAFEHRNHFPLIGIILAVGDLLTLIAQRLHAHRAAILTACILIFGLFGSATFARARTWGNPQAFAENSVKVAPHSARAWNSLCLYYYNLGGGRVPNNPYRNKAINICATGVIAAPYSLTNFTNLLVFKTLRGDANQTDWDHYIERLRHVNMGPENSQALWIIINNIRSGTPLNETGVLGAIDVILQRTQPPPGEYAAIGYLILGRLHKPELAYKYFSKYVESAPPNDALTREIVEELTNQGQVKAANKLEALAKTQGNSR